MNYVENSKWNKDEQTRTETTLKIHLFFGKQYTKNILELKK